MSVRLLTSCPAHKKLRIPMSELDIISHNCCPWRKGVSWPWLKVIPPRSMSQCTHTENPCPGYNYSVSSWIWIIFHTIVAHDPCVCHDLDPRSYLQGQGHSAHILEIRVRVPRPLPFMGPFDGDDISHNCCPLLRGCCCGGICPVRTRLVTWGFISCEFTNVSNMNWK